MNERNPYYEKKRNNSNSFSNIDNSNAYISRSKFKCSYPEIME